MPYYRGDYYRGDYYRGDPGPFSFIEKAVKGVARAVVPGFSAAEQVVRGLTGGGKQAAVTATANPFGMIPGGQYLPQMPTKTDIAKGVAAIIPGPVGNIAQLMLGPMQGVGPAGPAMSGNPCGSGYHLDKKTRSYCVRNRSTNVLNPRALSRALRRAEGFEKVARRTVTALHRGPSKFKKKGRR